MGRSITGRPVRAFARSQEFKVRIERAIKALLFSGFKPSNQIRQMLEQQYMPELQTKATTRLDPSWRDDSLMTDEEPLPLAAARGKRQAPQRSPKKSPKNKKNKKERMKSPSPSKIIPSYEDSSDETPG